MDLSVIPAGLYCYGPDGVCPYWSKRADKPAQENGYCALLKAGDWEAEHTSLLWDQVKECGINDAAYRFAVVAFGLKDGTAEQVRERIRELLETEFNVVVKHGEAERGDAG